MRKSEIYKLTKTELASLQAFSKERLAAFYYWEKTKKKSINLSPTIEAHLLAVIFNGLTDAYFAGLAARSRCNRPKFLAYMKTVDAYTAKTLDQIAKSHKKRK